MQELIQLKILQEGERISDAGKPYGGYSFSRGALYSILRNPVYIGKIKHKRQVYEGLHESLIDEEKWQRVQQTLTDNTVTLKTKTRQRHILQGLLFNGDGVFYSPSFTKKQDRQYRYYMSQNLLQFKNHPKGLIARLPAHEIEQAIENMVRTHITTTFTNDYVDCDGCIHIAKHIHDVSMEKITHHILNKVVVQSDTLTLAF